MLAKTYNFSIDQGATRELQIILKDANKTPIPLSTYTAKLQVKQLVRSKPVIELTTENDGIVLNDQGQIIITFLPSQTSMLQHNKYIYDLLLIRSSTNKEYIIKGEITVYLGVTK